MTGVLIFHAHLHGVFALKQNCWFQFPFEEKRSGLIINNIDTSLLIHDLFNHLEKETEGTALKNVFPKYNPLENKSNNGMEIIISVNDDPNAITRSMSTLIQFGQKDQRILSEKNITEIIGAIEIENIESVSGENHKSLRMELIKKILNFFINKYNQCSRISSVATIGQNGGNYGDFIVIRNDILEYGKQIHKFEEIFQKEFKFSLNGDAELANTPLTPNSLSKNLAEECTKKMFDALKSKISIEHELLSNALELFGYSKNYKFALLESFIAAEAVIERVLKKLKLSKGISNNKLKEYKKEVPISYKINIELRLILIDLMASEIETINKVDSVRKKRNLVVHEAEEVNSEEARAAINSVYDLLDLFDKRELL